MLKLRFDDQINGYLVTWNTLADSTIHRKKNALPIQAYRYWQIKKQLKRISKIELPKEPAELSHFKDEPELNRLIEMWLQFDIKKMDNTLQGDYVTATEQFVKRVKDYWPDMSNESIFQALRNVWIMIALLIMAEKPIVLTDSMFAYSMLYPLTDNVLDDPLLTKQEKMNFVNNLGARLNGTQVTGHSEHEADVYKMVSLIENQFDRGEFPEVYESVLLIHKAQEKSLSQQYNSLSDLEILKLSFEKGAASVIADGYLVFGSLSDSFFKFLTGYGIVLQLADDLQDITDDLEAGHRTLFNICENSDDLTNRLSLLSLKILEDLPCNNNPLKLQLATLLDKSMTFLICDAIYTHKKRFTKKFYRSIDKSHFTGLEHHAKLKRQGEQMMKHWQRET